MIRAEQLESVILGILRLFTDGQRDGSLAGWRESIKERFRESPDNTDLVAALKRLRDYGLIRLVKWVSAQLGWYEYTKQDSISEKWFFYKGTFVVQITDEGRRYWDSPIERIGFKVPL